MPRPFAPAEFGDLGLRHEVDVFVYRYSSEGMVYLLLHPRPRLEAFWRPVVEPVGLDEDLRHAAIRGVRQETGIVFAHDLVPAGTGLLQHIGDLQLVQWAVGYQVRRWDVSVRLRQHVADSTWRTFEQAMRTLGATAHRQNLLQLHTRLTAA